MHLAKMKSVLSQICNPVVEARVDVSSIRNLNDSILDLAIAELNRNGAVEPARAINTLQEKKNCLARLAEIFNSSNRTLLPYLSTTAALDIALPTSAADADAVAAVTAAADNLGIAPIISTVDSSMVLQDEDIISDGVSSMALPALLPSSSSSADTSNIVASVAAKSRGRKSAATKEAEEAERKRARLALVAEDPAGSYNLPIVPTYVTAINSNVQILDISDMPPLVGENTPFDGSHGIIRGRPIFNGVLQSELDDPIPVAPIAPLVPANIIVNPNIAPLYVDDVIEPLHDVVAPILMDANARKVAENRKAFICDKVLDYICKSGTDVTAAAIGRKTLEFGAAFDTLVSLNMIDPLAFVTPTTVPLVTGALSPTALGGQMNFPAAATVASSLKATPIDQWFAPVRQEEIDNLREIINIFEHMDTSLDSDLSNSGLWYQKAMKIVSRPFLRLSDVLFMVNSAPILNHVGTFGFNDITSGHSLFKIVSRDGDFITIQHVHTVGVMNAVFSQNMTIKTPQTLAVLSQSGVADLRQSGHLTGVTVEPPLGKLQAADRKGKILQFRTAESLNKLTNMSFMHGISNTNRSVYDERLYGSELTNLEAESFATNLFILADMEKTNRGVVGVSSDVPTTLVLEIVSSIGHVVSCFDVWVVRPRLDRHLKGNWSEQERDSLSLLNFQVLGPNGILKFPTSMGDIAMLLQNFEYVLQVIGCSSWSGLVRAINQKLNFEIVSLNLDSTYVMNSLHSHICALMHWMTHGVSPAFPIQSLDLVQKESSARLARVSLTKLGQLMNDNVVVYNADKFKVTSVVNIPKKSTDEKKKPGKSGVVEPKGMLRES